MKKKIIIGAIILLAAVAVGFVIYKISLPKKVLHLYGADTDLEGKGIKDLKAMIAAFNKQKGGANE